MKQDTASKNIIVMAASVLLLSLLACGKKEPAPAVQPAGEPAAQSATQPAPSQSLSEINEPQHDLVLPVAVARRTGDLEEILKARNLRALVVNGRTGFFYDKGQPHGIFYEALDEFQKFVNQKFKTGKLPVKVTFIPVRPDQLESGLMQGIGDLVGIGVFITPELEQRVAFSAPFNTDVKLVVVTGRDFGPVNTLDDLSGKVI